MARSPTQSLKDEIIRLQRENAALRERQPDAACAECDALRRDHADDVKQLRRDHADDVAELKSDIERAEEDAEEYRAKMQRAEKLYQDVAARLRYDAPKLSRWLRDITSGKIDNAEDAVRVLLNEVEVTT